MISAQHSTAASRSRADVLFDEHLLSIHQQTDRLFAGLLAVEFILGIAAAYWISPRTWAGTISETHIHVWTAILLGGLIVSLPISLAIAYPGRKVTRHTIAIGQMAYSALLIHLLGGRIETHFHVFGSLAFLAFYRDWRVLITATVVIGLDHLIRSIYWPLSVFGVLTASPWRAFEHIGWVVFEDIFLILSCLRCTKEMMQISGRQAQLESTNEVIENEVQERTADLANANKQIKRDQYLLNTFVETIPDPVFFKDREGRFIRVNQAMATECQYENPADLIGKTDADIWGSNFPTETIEDERRILETGEPLINKEEQPTLPGSAPRWVLVTKMALRNEEGEIVGTFGLAREITKRKLQQQEIERINEDLRQARDASEAANLAKSEFLANMSHEIRTPMNAIIGMTELVLDSDLNATQRDYLQIVDESAESLLSIINEILDFSKIESGRLELQTIDFELQEQVGDTLKSLGQRAYAKNLELAWHVHPDVPIWLSGDPTRLRQMLVNLVGNAIKFTEQGEVLVEMQCESRRNSEVTLHVSVRDTGGGIPEEKQATIFSAFEQVDSSTTRRFGGTGLGLAITARIAEAMGGRVWVDSTLGVGSTFHFTAVFQEAMERHTDTKQLPDLNGVVVVIVDDNKTNLHILQEILQSWGMSVHAVANGSQAISELTQTLEKNQKLPLLISDVNMPEMDGFELVERLRSLESLCNTVVILLTSGGRSGDLNRCEMLKVSGHLMKPVKQSELLETILIAVGKQPSTESVKQPVQLADEVLLPSLKILLAEDSKANQILAVGLLTKWGHRTTVAENGQQAVDLWRDGSFDLILMDVQMPVMDGLEATRKIRELELEARLDAHIPIIAMTARAMKGDRESCLESGMDSYISKPIRRKIVFEAIESLVAVSGNITSDEDRKTHSTPSDDAQVSDAVVDWSVALTSVEGDQEILMSIVEAALEEVPVLTTTLNDALQTDDVQAANRSAHSIKSIAVTFGAKGLHECARKMEADAEAGLLEDVKKRQPKFNQLVEQFLNALNQRTSSPD